MFILIKDTSKKIAAALLVCSMFLSFREPVTSEYQVKAVFLFNFTQFVDWPSESFQSEQEPFVIGVLGENPFGPHLENAVAGEKVNGHPISVTNFKNVEDIKICHILFINKSQANLPAVIASLKGRNVLTVSDASNFLQQGGMIRFVTKDEKIQLQIYLDAAKSARLNISSKLLRLAEIYAP